MRVIALPIGARPSGTLVSSPVLDGQHRRGRLPNVQPRPRNRVLDSSREAVDLPEDLQRLAGEVEVLDVDGRTVVDHSKRGALRSVCIYQGRLRQVMGGRIGM